MGADPNRDTGSRLYWRIRTGLEFLKLALWTVFEVATRWFRDSLP